MPRDAPSTTTIATRKGAVAPLARTSVEQPVERPSMATLVKDAVGETAEVLHAQVQLAVLEVREDAQVAVRVGVVFGLGGALAFLALALFLAAAAFGLAQFMPAWQACAIVGGVVAVIAAIVLARGRQQLRAHRFAEHSAVALEEDAQWIREKLS